MGEGRKIANPNDLPVGQQLCTSCGLCCTGALHDYAMVFPGEEAGATSLGLAVLDDPEPCFALPCPQLDGTRCGAFASPDRPSVCARYRCQLLIDVESGEEALPEALEKVAVAHDLLATLDALHVPDLMYPEARSVVAPHLHPAITASARRKIGADEKRWNRVRLHATAFMMFIDRHFRERHKPATLSMMPVSPSEYRDDA